MFAVCKVPEDTEHFLFHCDAYKEERDCLEKSVEGVLYAEGIFTVCDINLKALSPSPVPDPRLRGYGSGTGTLDTDSRGPVPDTEPRR